MPARLVELEPNHSYNAETDYHNGLRTYLPVFLSTTEPDMELLAHHLGAGVTTLVVTAAAVRLAVYVLFAYILPRQTTTYSYCREENLGFQWALSKYNFEKWSVEAIRRHIRLTDPFTGRPKTAFDRGMKRASEQLEKELAQEAPLIQGAFTPETAQALD